MDVQPEILWGGIATGYASLAVAIRVVYAQGKAQAERIEAALGERILALEAERAQSRTFERETLVGLISAATEAIKSSHAAGARLSRMVEILHVRFGEAALSAAEDARHQAQHEVSGTHPTRLHGHG